MEFEQSKLKFSQGTFLSRIINRPPFYFEGVTMRVFPVRANLATIRAFCDKYINFVPPEIARYEPFVPFVYLCFINYGRMQQIQDVGWVAQNELAFTIPLQWYRTVDGKRQFQDVVSFSPFIYVDVEMSEITGREVYGWPKEYAFLSRDLDAWARNPRLNTKLLSVERRVPDRDSTVGWSRGAFLDVMRKPPPSFSMIPSEFENPFNPAATAARVAWGGWYVFRTLGEVAASSPLRGFPAITPQAAMAQLSQIATNSSVMAAGPFAPWGALQKSLNSKTMNLKQFHMASDPRKACYQALVHADMTLERFNRGGLLGDYNVLLGDPTGGFKLRLFRKTAGNLIEALGLEADAEESVNDERAIVLRPVLPFWVDLDLEYGTGYPIGWRLPGELPRGSRKEKSLWWNAPDLDKSFEPEHEDHGQFRDARAIPWEAAIGPYFAPQVATRMMLLAADRGKLADFCESYLNKPLEEATPKTCFEPWGGNVLLVATNYESLTDGNGTVNSWVHRELSFLVPVIWRKNDASRSILDVGFVTAYLFADSDIETIMLRERLGLPIVRATLGSPESIWMSEFQPDAGSVPLLTLETEVTGAFYPGERIEEKKLLQIAVADMVASTKMRAPGSSGSPAKKSPVPRDVANAVKTLEKLVQLGPVPLNRFTLKEYPDARNAKRACYQALIQSHISLDRLTVKPFMEPGLITVEIDRYPSFPIVETLGLRANSLPIDGDHERVRDQIVPEEAFWIQSDATYAKEVGHCWSGRDGKWQRGLPIKPNDSTIYEKITPGAVIKAWIASLRKQDKTQRLGKGS